MSPGITYFTCSFHRSLIKIYVTSLFTFQLDFVGILRPFHASDGVIAILTWVHDSDEPRLVAWTKVDVGPDVLPSLSPNSPLFLIRGQRWASQEERDFLLDFLLTPRPQMGVSGPNHIIRSHPPGSASELNPKQETKAVGVGDADTTLRVKCRMLPVPKLSFFLVFSRAFLLVKKPSQEYFPRLFTTPFLSYISSSFPLHLSPCCHPSQCCSLLS